MRLLSERTDSLQIVTTYFQLCGFQAVDNARYTRCTWDWQHVFAEGEKPGDEELVWTDVVVGG